MWSLAEHQIDWLNNFIFSSHASNCHRHSNVPCVNMWVMPRCTLPKWRTVTVYRRVVWHEASAPGCMHWCRAWRAKVRYLTSKRCINAYKPGPVPHIAQLVFATIPCVWLSHNCSACLLGCCLLLMLAPPVIVSIFYRRSKMPWHEKRSLWSHFV